MTHTRRPSTATLFLADMYADRAESLLLAFQSLNALAIDAETLALHIQKENQKLELDDKPADFAELLIKISNATRILGLHSAFKVYRQQSIVVLVSFIEGLIQECFNCIFCMYPLRMHDFLYPKSEGTTPRGKVALDELVRSESREQLLLSLASKASDVALQGKFRSICKNLQQVSGSSFDEDNLNKLLPLVEQRNRLLHEFSDEDVSAEEVENAFKLVLEFVGDAEKALTKIGVPVAPISATESPDSMDRDS